MREGEGMGKWREGKGAIEGGQGRRPYRLHF